MKILCVYSFSRNIQALYSILSYYRFWFTCSIMARRNVLNQVAIIILVTLLLLVVIGETKSTKKTRHCLKNCHRCKRHYGDLFVSHLCARTCIKHEGRFFCKSYWKSYESKYVLTYVHT